MTGNQSGIPITVSSSGTPISVTFGKYDNSPGIMNISIYFNAASSGNNILVIILSVLGGILFIGLIIGACYIIRNMRSSEIIPSQREIVV